MRLVAGIWRRACRALERLGIDGGQYRSLLWASLLEDWRRSDPLAAAEPRAEGRPFLYALGLYALLSGLASAVLLVAPNLRLYLLGTLSFNLLLLLLALFVEFGASLAAPADLAVVAPRPVSSRTYLAAKLSNVFLYLLQIDLALALPPTLLGLLRPETSWGYAPAYLLVSLLLGLFAAGMSAALFLLLVRLFAPEGLQQIFRAAQLSGLIAVVFAFHLAARWSAGHDGAVYGAENSISPFPPAWYAAAVELLMGNRTRMPEAAAGVAASLLGILLVALLLSERYIYRISEALALDAGRRARRAKRRSANLDIARSIAGDAVARALFSFVLAMLARNRYLRFQLSPLFILALYPLFACRDSPAGPATAASEIAFAAAGAALIAAALLPYCDEFRGRWIFHSAPAVDAGRAFAGIRRALMLAIVLPVSLLAAAAASLCRRELVSLSTLLFGISTGFLALQLGLRFQRSLPFTREPRKGLAGERIGMALLFAAIAAALFTIVPERLDSEGALLWSAAALLLIAEIISLRCRKRTLKRSQESGARIQNKA